MYVGHSFYNERAHKTSSFNPTKNNILYGINSMRAWAYLMYFCCHTQTKMLSCLCSTLSSINYSKSFELWDTCTLDDIPATPYFSATIGMTCVPPSTLLCRSTTLNQLFGLELGWLSVVSWQCGLKVTFVNIFFLYSGYYEIQDEGSAIELQLVVFY